MNTIVENFIGKVDPDVWYIGLLKEIVSFCSDPNFDVPRGVFLTILSMALIGM